MRWSLYIGRYAGTKVLIHWTFLLLLLWIGFSAYRQGATTPEILLTVSFILTVFICVLLHEFGHALTAKKFGIATKKSPSFLSVDWQVLKEFLKILKKNFGSPLPDRW
ncbi:MAG: hypothetical protein NVV82_06520 [Sporocytophaga sp.]|nr:hypothetical protein [Sporocytophaga sp.]